MKKFLPSMLATFVTLTVVSLLLFFLGESPVLLWDALRNTLFTNFGLGFTLFYTVPLILTGLSVALCFHAGLFNIGAEGQLYMGSLGVLFFPYYFPTLSPILAIGLAVVSAMILGGVWGWVAGFFKAMRGSHEVITTILLNFIAIAVVEYFILYPWKNPESQNPESFVVPPSYQLPLLSEWTPWFGSTPANVTLFLALLAAVSVYFFLYRTTFGFEMRVVGQNPTVARFSGISVKKSTMMALTLSGILAGLVGVNEVMGSQHRLINGFSPGYGFTGIAVALLGRNHPLGVVFAAFLFATLQNSAREIEFLSDRVTKEISLIMQGLVVALIACQWWERIRFSRKKILVTK